MVEKVFEGNDSFARKTIRDNYDTEKIMMELKILRLATETKNPHLLHLRCAYQHDNQMCLVTYPWCEFDLRTFLDGSSEMELWLKLKAKDKLILITDWMACLASGLSALHKKKIKHQDLKPENVLLCLLGDRMMHYLKPLQMIPNLSRFKLPVNTFLQNSSLVKSVERVMCSLLVSSSLSLAFFSLVKKV
jgi:serine/threonine protein kinase